MIGESYRSLSNLYRISPQSFGMIVPETCSAIINALKNNVKVSIWLIVSIYMVDTVSSERCVRVGGWCGYQVLCTGQFSHVRLM